ncbi:MAG: helix-turn-helix domain-containing protein [Acidimicrobiales bacterium]
MSPDSKRRSGQHQPTLDHPALSEALVALSRSLDRRASGDEEAPSYLDLAVAVSGLQRQLDDLTIMLVHYARRYEGTTWTDVAQAFGISRPTVYKRFGEASPNDVAE